MKKKILFYGNCQLGVIARFFRLHLSDKFEVQICRDCGLDPFWDEGLFAVWTPKNRDSQQRYKECLHSKIQGADIFVFQDHSGRFVIDELKTKYLHDVVAKGLKVCLPDTRFFAHLTDPRILEPYLEYIASKGKGPEETISYLQKSDDPELLVVMQNDYPFNKNYRNYRNENTQRYEEEVKLYDNRLQMCDYIEREFQSRLLSVSHNHMNECFFIEMLNRLFCILGVDTPASPIKTLEIPGYKSIDPRQFNFFTKAFPNLDYGGFAGSLLTAEHLSFFYASK